MTDGLRGTRETPAICSASLLAPLVEEFGAERVEIRMYHTPNLTGLRKTVVPRRFNEGWGLQHMKLYGCDDEIIMSGYVATGPIRKQYTNITQSQSLQRLLHKPSGSLPCHLRCFNHKLLSHSTPQRCLPLLSCRPGTYSPSSLHSSVARIQPSTITPYISVSLYFRLN